MTEHHFPLLLSVANTHTQTLLYLNDKAKAQTKADTNCPRYIDAPCPIRIRMKGTPFWLYAIHFPYDASNEDVQAWICDLIAQAQQHVPELQDGEYWASYDVAIHNDYINHCS